MFKTLLLTVAGTTGGYYLIQYLENAKREYALKSKIRESIVYGDLFDGINDMPQPPSAMTWDVSGDLYSRAVEMGGDWRS